MQAKKNQGREEDELHTGAAMSIKACTTLIALLFAWFVVPIMFIAYVKEDHETTSTKSRQFSINQTPYRPHILFVVMDDLGSHDLGMHGTGIRTPFADFLARKGLFLNNYYVTPSCTPTRIALMTGRYPYMLGNYKAIAPYQSAGMPLGIETLPQVLKRAGYSTHAVGKWHLGHAKYKHLPTFRGFKSFYGFYAGGGQDHYSHVCHGGYDMRYDNKEFCGKSCSQIVDARGKYSSTIFQQASSRIIMNHNTERDGPLFLYLAYAAVHTPIQVPRKYKDMYRKKRHWSSRRKGYAGMLTAADRSLGKVIKSLQNAGMWKDTLVVYTSDNGAAVNIGSNFPLRGGKMDVWEGGVISDGIISGPAREKVGIRKGRMGDLFHAVDWLPTLAGIVGVSPKSTLSLDGVNQLQTLKGGEPSRLGLFLGFGVGDWKGPQTVRRPRLAALRWRDMKLVRDLKSNKNYLYNLKMDPRETKNVASKKREKTRKLLQKLNSFVGETVAPLPKKDKNCGEQSFGRTKWGAKLWKPWC